MTPGAEEHLGEHLAVQEIRRYNKTTTIIGAGLLAIVVIVIAVFAMATSGGGSKKTMGQVPAPTKTIAQKTAEKADGLRTILCGSVNRGCVVDGSTPGVVSVTVTSPMIGETQLDLAGNQTGLWSNADVARMLHTRALDGTQRTPDGSVSWTYHPDDGLQLIVDTSR